MFRLLAAFSLMSLPAVATAQNAVAVVSEMFVEKTVVENGKPKTVVVKQKSGPPGTKLLFTHSYRNTSARPVANFGMTNPMPGGVTFAETSDASASVSADGGKSWGALAALKVKAADGSLRAARPEDVTHVRWALKAAIAPGGAGKFSFRGTVK